MSKNITFTRHILFLLLINLIIKPFYLFGIDRTVQNQVGPDEYGLFFALFNFTYLFQLINDLGIQQYNTRLAAQAESLSESYFGRFVWSKILLNIGYFIAVILGALIIGYPPHYWPFILMIAGNQVLISWILYLRSNINGRGYFRLDAWLSVTDKLWMILLIGSALVVPAWRSTFTIFQFIILQFISYLVTVLIAIILNRSLVNIRVPKWDGWQVIWETVKKTYPFAIVVLLMTLYTRVDGIMIERLLEDGKYEAGVYAAGYRLLDAVNMIAFLFATLLLPMFSAHINSKDSLNKLFTQAISQLAIIAFIAIAGIWYYKNEIMEVLYPTHDVYWAKVMGWLILSFLPICVIYIASTLITAGGNLKPMNLVFLFSIVLNIALNYWLITTNEALGAALATLITQTFTALGILYICYHQYRIFPLLRYLRLLLVGIGVSIIFYATDFLSIYWLWGFVIGIVLSCGMTFLLMRSVFMEIYHTLRRKPDM